MHRLAPLLGVLLLAAAVTQARADEIFVLDNGEVLKGWVIQERDSDVHVRLTGFVRNASVHIPQTRILRRYRVDRLPEEPRDARAPTDWARAAHRVDSTITDDTNEQRGGLHIPAEEPSIRDEGFFQRLARVTALSIPEGLESRILLGTLLLVALLMLILMGGRLAEIDSLGLGRAAILATLLGTALALDVLFHADALRADRAIWLVPAQGLTWIGTAAVLLRCGVTRAVLLFAFVLFSLTVVAFCAGAILMSF